MSSGISHRQRMLFLVAILLPCAAIVALGLLLMSRERELAEKRRLEEERTRLGHFSQELLVRLERIRLQQMTALAGGTGAAHIERHADPAIALAAAIDGNRLVLPWETNPALAEARKLLGEPGFTGRIADCERQELRENKPGEAAASYRQVLQTVRAPVQAAYVRLLLARALTAAARPGEARASYEALLALPPGIIDDQGIPFRLYAARQLIQAAGARENAIAAIRQLIESRPFPAPAEAHMLRALAKELATSTSDFEKKLDDRIRFLEQALALQNDFPHLKDRIDPGQERDADPVWMPYGEDLWLASTGPRLGQPSPVLLAVRAEAVGAGGEFVNSAGTKGEPLGASFPALRVRFMSPVAVTDGRQKLQYVFYSLTLVLVLAVTLLGAGFLWRDVRREIRLAEMRSQFVASVSHELKTPLTSIRMFAETLQMGRAADPETIAECADTIVNESERLTRLLNNVLDFSKIERGQRAYRRVPACLADLVRAAARTLKYPLAEQGFDLRIDIENGLPPAPVDADAIQQAVLNLLHNAMKYSGASREIGLRLRRANGWAVIEVSDKGVGIHPEEQTRIFEKFYRVPAPENRLIPGTGLGLTLVAHIARGHGGRVTVRSAPGQGSTFAIHLPLEAEA